MLLNCGVGEDSWESLGLQGDPTSPSERRSILGVHWKDRCWSWNSNTLATWCKELTDLKRPWCWERLKAGGEGVNRGWNSLMVSLTHWTWIWANCRRWRTGKPGVLQSWGCREWDTIWRLNNNKIQNSSEWKYFRGLKYIFKEMFYLRLHVLRISALQFSSVAQLCPTLCDPMDCSTPGVPVHHQLP